MKTLHITSLDEIQTINETDAQIIIFDIPIIPQEICKDNKQLTHIIFTNKVQCVGAGAFKNCSNLHFITFGKNLRRIENFAFQDCSSLDCHLILPPTMLSVGIGAFSNCFKNIEKNEVVKNLLFYNKDSLVFQSSDKDKIYGFHFQNVDIHEDFHSLKLSSEISTQEQLGFLLQGFVIDTYEKIEKSKKLNNIKITHAI